jgi:hypothetical protein
MSDSEDFTESELWAIETTLKERWPGESIELQQADVDIRLFPEDRELSERPAVVWEHGTTSFVVIKAFDRNYRCQFYYRGYQQYGTGKNEFDDLTDCIVTMLQVHADKEAQDREQA